MAPSSAASPISRHQYDRLPRHPLVLCASLVENPMNLGALCRTAEVFRLESLVLPTLAVTADRTFRKLAASAHHWQPLTACPPAHLEAWIRVRQQGGSTVLALSRETGATPLPQVMFARNTTLILGRELTGIPATILQLCDGAIAIPQFGLVESLNVQVAAAIATYAYICRQIPNTEV